MMRTRNRNLDQGLRSADPLVGEDLDHLSPGAEELLASIISSERGTIASSRPRRDRVLPGTSRRRLLVAVPLTAALIGALIAGLPGGGEGGRSTLPALARVAQAAAAQAPLETDLPYLYTKTRFTGTSVTVAGGRAWEVYEPETREEWIAKDGSGRVWRIKAPPRWVSSADREAWEAAGRIRFLAHGWDGHTEEEELPAGYFSGLLTGGEALSALPTGPEELAAWLEQGVRDPKADAGAGNGFSVPVRALTLVGDLLNNPLASPELRAALYEAVGLIPGVEYLGEATDEIGRHGVAVGAESANSGAPTLYSVIFDPRTSRMLAHQEEIFEAPSALPDEGYPMKSSVLFLDSGATGSLTSRPR